MTYIIGIVLGAVALGVGIIVLAGIAGAVAGVAESFRTHTFKKKV